VDTQSFALVFDHSAWITIERNLFHAAITCFATCIHKNEISKFRFVLVLVCVNEQNCKRKMFRVSEKEYKELRQWMYSHPIATLDLPEPGQTQWIVVQHKQSPTGQLFLPPYFHIGKKQFVFMPLFPGSRATQVHLGGMGVVAAYQQTQDQNVVVVLKVSHLATANETLEQEAFEILSFLEATHRTPPALSCQDHFIKLSAGAVKTAEWTPHRASTTESFLVLEKMDMDLAQLTRDIPSLFQRGDYLRLIVRSLARGLACMHNSQPKPIAHGDFKPENVLCSPYTNQWLDTLDEHLDEADDQRINYVKIADFDVSFLRVWELRKTASDVHTPLYLSPARLLGNEKQSCADDMWALGLILLSITQQHKSVQDIHYAIRVYSTQHQLQQYVQNALATCTINWTGIWHVSPTKPQDISDFTDLVRGCLQVRTSDRTTINQFLAHPFFADARAKYRLNNPIVVIAAQQPQQSVNEQPEPSSCTIC